MRLPLVKSSAYLGDSMDSMYSPAFEGFFSIWRAVTPGIILIMKLEQSGVRVTFTLSSVRLDDRISKFAATSPSTVANSTLLTLPRLTLKP